MPKKIAKNPDAEAAQATIAGLTPNQIVAYNLTRAREWKGWTQDQVAEALAPYRGKRWSKASVSQAERSIAGKFIRNFDADEIVAFARAFDLPIGWFFLPPAPWTDDGRPVTLDTPDAGPAGTALAELVDLVFGTPEQQALLTLRLTAWLQQRPAQLTRAQRQIAQLVRHRIDTLANHTLGELDTWQTTLRAMANHLEDLATRARHATAEDLHTDDQ
jgi:transcriptional regulator with XRE-family HTH domain